MAGDPRIVAVTFGPPWARETFSGSSSALLAALERRGALVGAVDGRPKLVARVEQAASVSLDLERWRQRYNLGASPISGVARRARSRIASRRAARVAAAADVLLQLTGYFDPRGARPGMLHCSYHDGNLAGYLRRSDLRVDPSSRPVERAREREQALYDSLDLIFCMSDLLRRSFIEDFGQAPAKVVTVGAGPNLVVRERARAREAMPPRFLLVGKQFERKGGVEVVNAFRRLREDQPQAELWIVGPARLELDEPGITVFGRLSMDNPDGERRLADLYEAANVFVMPTYFDALGIAVIEAMAYRLPCISSTWGAIPELVDEGSTGFLIAPGDEDALLERMRRFATDPELGRRMGAAGYEVYRRRFSWDAVADRMLAAIARA